MYNFSIHIHIPFPPSLSVKKQEKVTSNGKKQRERSPIRNTDIGGRTKVFTK
jgi:hypothetical protein